MKRWVTATGGYSRDGSDLPCIKFWADDPSLRKWVDEQIVEDLVQFYPRDSNGNFSDCYSGPTLEDHRERLSQLFEAIDEEEDTLFAKVKDARNELVQLVMDRIIEDGEWEHQTFMSSDEGSYVTVRMVDIK